MLNKKDLPPRRPVSQRVCISWPKDAVRAKQSFAKEVDINAIVARYLSTGQIPPATSAPVYADMTKVPATLHEAMLSLRSAQSVISRLPADIRLAFERDPLGTLDKLVRAQAGGPGASGAAPAPGAGPHGSGGNGGAPTGTPANGPQGAATPPQGPNAGGGGAPAK